MSGEGAQVLFGSAFVGSSSARHLGVLSTVLGQCRAVPEVLAAASLQNTGEAELRLWGLDGTFQNREETEL